MPTYNDTRVNLSVVKTASDGKTPVLDEKTGEPVIEIQENITEKKANETIAAYKTAGLPDPEIVKIQTFQYTEVGEEVDLSGLEAVLGQYNPDADSVKKAAIAIVNRGLVLAQQRFGREFMTDSDQAPVEGVYDLMQDASKPGEGRRKADPASKAAKSLSELLGREVTAADLAAILASFQSASA